MAGVTFDHVTKLFNGVAAVKDFDLQIEDKEFLVLVGPSGCGKSTTLRLLAGLEEITEGEIYIGERLVNNIAAKDRDIAMVFQSYALYPHMSVFDNLAFGLTLRKLPKEEVRHRVREAAQILGIQELLKRKPRELSGGQRQRVALGRAIVREPAVFLFDEPLSNLDAKLRVQTRAELSKLHERLGTTFIYVTHDQVEAMTMATRIAVMKDGVLQQVGTPQELYERPANVFVAGFIGSPAMNFFDVTVKGGPEKIHLHAEGFTMAVPATKARPLAPYLGKKVVFGIRPENIHDSQYQPLHIQAALVEALVDVTELMGNEIFLHLLVGEQHFLARVDPRTTARPGHQVHLAFNMDRIHAFDVETEKAIDLGPA
ncbi:MAG: sn-glycerol-3-phosphate ABC transporter ATP-binding protein UgpC [Chloroflexi bacterium]|nr:sn-glycerol-3-phosphate ABC transporter ATP-binding protein UgpC [Chloroflexota bacterium]